MADQTYYPRPGLGNSIYLTLKASTQLTIEWGPFIAVCRVSVAPPVSMMASTVQAAIVRLDYSGKDVVPLVVKPGTVPVVISQTQPPEFKKPGTVLLQGSALDWTIRPDIKIDNEPTILEFVEGWNSVLQPISGAAAARKYSFLTNEILKNSSGNLRGIIVNKNAHTVFKFTKGLDKVTGAIAFYENLMLVGEEIRRSAREFESIEASGAEVHEKLARYSAAVTGVCLRSLGQIATRAVDGVTATLRVTKWINPVYWADQIFGINQFEKSMDYMDQLMAQQRDIYTEVYTGANVYFIINELVTR